MYITFTIIGFVNYNYVGNVSHSNILKGKLDGGKHADTSHKHFVIFFYY